MLYLERDGKDVEKNAFTFYSNTSQNTARTKEETTYLSISDDSPRALGDFPLLQSTISPKMSSLKLKSITRLNI